MSYTFSRRDFMKYSALTAVAVAGAGLLTGCEIQDPNNPSAKKLNATLTIGTTVAQLQTATVEGTQGVFTIKIGNNADNPLILEPTCFTVKVQDSEGKKVFSSDSSLKVAAKDAAEDVYPNLPKKTVALYNITVPGYTEPEADQTLVFTFIPRRDQPVLSMSWSIPAAGLGGSDPSTKE